MIEKEERDFLFTEDGDLFFDDAKEDFEIVNNVKNELLLSTLKRRLQSSNGDWFLEKAIVGNIDILKGATKSLNTIEVLKQIIFNTITEDFLVSPEDVEINTLGLVEEVMGIGVIINNRERDVNSRVNVGFTYDFRENRFSAFSLYEGF